MPKWNQFRPPRKLASYDPHDHQIAFHTDTHKYRALVSGVGAGKTRMGVEEVIKWTQLYPGSLGVIGRLTAKSLRETTQRRFFEVCPPELIANYNKSEEHLWIKTNQLDENGDPVYSEILFFHLDDPGPLGSLDISYFWIDEAHEPDGQEVPEPTFQMLTARLRHPVGPHRGFITSNSGGKDWVWNWFFNPEKRLPEYIGWVVPTEANAKYLPPGYVEELRRNNPPTWVARFLDASFDAFEGQIFIDFDERKHTFNPGEVDISPHWDHGAGFDFGVGAPTACVYGCMDRDGHLWVYDEDYEANADIDKFADRMKKKGFDTVQADPSVVNRGPNKKSPKQLYQEQGVYLIPASNDEDYFLTLFIDMLRKDKVHISTRCVHLINQIKQAAWDPLTLTGTTHDKMKRMENHALDAFKYLVNTIGMKPGLLNPVVPGAESKSFHVGKEWEHESYLDDEDFEKDDYVHSHVKREVLN
jgi:phage terminase large subunit